MTETKTAKKRPLYKNLWFWGVLVGIIGMPLMRSCFIHRPEPPPVVGEAPSFELATLDGKPFGSAQLKGDVWVAHVYDASCGEVCDKALSDMEWLHRKYSGRLEGHRTKHGPVSVKQVTFVVGDVAAAKAKLSKWWAELESSVDPERWRFLTGSQEAMTKLVAGFDALRDEKITKPWDLTVIVIDQKGQVRGFYGPRKEENRSPIHTRRDEVFHRSKDVTKRRNQ